MSLLDEKWQALTGAKAETIPEDVRAAYEKDIAPMLENGEKWLAEDMTVELIQSRQLMWTYGTCKRLDKTLKGLPKLIDSEMRKALKGISPDAHKFTDQVMNRLKYNVTNEDFYTEYESHLSSMVNNLVNKRVYKLNMMLAAVVCGLMLVIGGICGTIGYKMAGNQPMKCVEQSGALICLPLK